MNNFKKQIAFFLLFMICAFQSFAGDKIEILVDKKGVSVERNGVIDTRTVIENEKYSERGLAALRDSLSQSSNNPDYKIEVVIGDDVLKRYDNGVLVDMEYINKPDMIREANPNNYSQSDVPKTIESNDLNISDDKIKYDIFDIQKDDFKNDVERNCVLKEVNGNSKSYACSDNQNVVITDDALFSKKETTVNNDLFSISKTQYSYVIYGLLFLLLLVFI